MLPLRKVRPLELPLPDAWQGHVKAALVSAAGILHYVLTYVHGWAVTSPLADVRVRAERQRLEGEVGLLREELRIKDARIAQLEALVRPHHLPHMRLAILMLQAARAWSAAQTARCFHLSPSTVALWQRRLRQEGEDGLLAPREAINRFPDFVREIVHLVKRMAPGAGARRIADLLARASIHVSATTVRRALDTRELLPPPRNRPTVSADARA